MGPSIKRLELKTIDMTFKNQDKNHKTFQTSARNGIERSE